MNKPLIALLEKTGQHDKKTAELIGMSQQSISQMRESKKTCLQTLIKIMQATKIEKFEFDNVKIQIKL